MRFSKRWPRDTSEPAPTAPGRGADAAPAGRVGAAGRPGVRSGTGHAARSGSGAGRRAALGGPPDRVGDHVWAVGLSADHGAVARGRLARESQPGRPGLAAGGAESPAATAKPRPAVARGWLLSPSSPGVPAPRVATAAHGRRRALPLVFSVLRDTRPFACRAGVPGEREQTWRWPTVTPRRRRCATTPSRLAGGGVTVRFGRSSTGRSDGNDGAEGLLSPSGPHSYFTALLMILHVQPSGERDRPDATARVGRLEPIS